MKTKSIFRLSLLALLFLFLSNVSKAQAPSCPYPVTNGMSCPVNVTIVLYNGSVPCKSYPSVTIPAGSTYMAACLPGCSNGITDVSVTVNWAINPTNVPFTATTADGTNTLVHGTFSMQPCSHGADFTVQWKPAGTLIFQ